MHRICQSIAVLFIVALAACASVPQPQSLQQSIIYGYGTVASVRNTAATLLKSGAIKVDEAKMVQGLADQARGALDVASAAVKNGKTLDAESSLKLATQVLTHLEAYLAGRK